MFRSGLLAYFRSPFIFVRLDRALEIPEEIRGVKMGIVKLVWKMFRKLWPSSDTLSAGIDCHKWESKMEIFRNFSGKHN